MVDEDADLDFAVRLYIWQNFLPADPGQLPGKLVGEPDGKRHQHGGMVAGKAEKCDLIFCSDFIDFFFGELIFIKPAGFIYLKLLRCR